MMRRTTTPCSATMWERISWSSTALTAVSAAPARASREGERMLPTPPRPVENTWGLGLVSAGWEGRGSRPRGVEKSSGPSGLASREAEARRMFPAPPRPDDCCEG